MLGELNEEEIQQVLSANSIGRIGYTDGNEIYIVPVNYRHEKDAVMCYSLEGHKIETMRQHPAVCFEVEEIQSADRWKCVVIHGVFEEITDIEELHQIRPLYTEYFIRRRLSRTAVPQTEHAELPEQVFYRIRFSKVSGRFETGFL